MSKITYEIVEHDGGSAYRVDGVYSEPFPSHDEARRAAELAAKEQAVPGDTTDISYGRLQENGVGRVSPHCTLTLAKPARRAQAARWWRSASRGPRAK